MRTLVTVNGRLRLVRRRWHDAQTSTAPADAWLDVAERTISEGVCEMACRVNQGATSFVGAAGTLARTARIDLGKERLRQLVEGEARLLVPLRVAGRIHGALVLTARPPAVLREAHLRPAQQLADIVAAHLELLRRTALLPAPYMPGWKKVRPESS